MNFSNMKQLLELLEDRMPAKVGCPHILYLKDGVVMLYMTFRNDVRMSVGFTEEDNTKPIPQLVEEVIEVVKNTIVLPTYLKGIMR